MEKFGKRAYKNLFDYLVDEVSFFENIRDFVYKETSDYSDGFDKEWGFLDTDLSKRIKIQVLSSFRPLSDMWRDLKNTFKPYKTTDHHVVKDALQPIRGVGNLLIGIVSIVATPIIFIFESVRNIFESTSFDNYKSRMKMSLAFILSFFTNGVSSIIRGTTQILTTPLTWIFRIPLRGILTAVKGHLKIQESSTVQSLVNEGMRAAKNQNPQVADCARQELHRKFKKAERQGQEISISDQEGKLFGKINFPKNENKHYQEEIKEDQKEILIEYFRLFKTEKSIKDQSTFKPTRTCQV